MKPTLSKDRRAELVERIRDLFAEQLDREIGELGAGLLVDFFLEEMGPSVYNQGVHDAVEFVQEKLLDLEGELRWPEEPPAR